MESINNNKNNPLANERIGKLLVKMVVPAVIAQIVNLLYNIVDRMFISGIPYIGTLALTGVGVTFPNNVNISFCVFNRYGWISTSCYKDGAK